MPDAGGRHVAVIGGGVSGLTASHILHGSNNVTLYEADDRLGGHAHTHDVPDGAAMQRVDTGFIVHNRRTYPRLCRLFDELGIQTRPTEMSLSVSCHGCGLEYCGARGPAGLFAQRRNAVNPRFAALLAQVPRFHARARRLLDSPPAESEPTLGEFLRQGRYSDYFVRHFVVPLVSAVWSVGPHQVTEYPARYLFTFLAHHGMLSVTGSPSWRTVVGGSRQYVDLVAKRLDDVRLATPVRGVRRSGDDVWVRDDADRVDRYDAVVIACHADQALRLLEDPTDAERETLGSFEYSRNETVLHSDRRVLPGRSSAVGSWNYRLPSCHPTTNRARVSYSMNRLQGLDTDTPFIVTLGDIPVDPDSVIDKMVYRHPVYTPVTLAAQRRLGELNTAATVYAGAYHGWGFHEDGCRAGAEAAAALGATW